MTFLFSNKVLQISNGIEEPGILRWELVACLITAWIMVYFSIWKSIKSSAQVRYLTATLPFLLIVVFLTRSLTLDGAAKGLQFFFHPRWELLGDAKVPWKDYESLAWNLTCLSTRDWARPNRNFSLNILDNWNRFVSNIAWWMNLDNS